MRLLRWEALCAIVAFALTQTFILVPGPYAMALFTFIAQPLFAIVAIGYLLKVRADLRKRALAVNPTAFETKRDHGRGSL